MTILRTYGPEEKCDRCSHALKFHREDRCMVAASMGRIAPRSGDKAKQCWCDGWFPKP